MSDFSIEQINDQPCLASLVERLTLVAVMAVDLETIEWWNRERERIALVQIAYRSASEIKVAVIDSLALEKLEPLRQSFENQSTLKVIHNAAFDAVRLQAHYQLQVAPVHDTMVAARLNQEKKYSLQAQAAAHLGLHLEKGAQRSDWSRRPLTPHQLHYAALDAAATLRLYEHQQRRNLFGNYRLRGTAAVKEQARLPLIDNSRSQTSVPQKKVPEPPPELLPSQPTSLIENNSLPSTDQPLQKPEISGAELALLGIIAELPNRYGPEQLIVSVGASQRVGLAGWIIDHTLGRETEFEEETAKLAIADLCERRLVAVTPTGRLEATGARADL